MYCVVCARTAAPFPSSIVSPPHRPAYAATQCVVSVRCNAPPDRQGSSPFPGRGRSPRRSPRRASRWRSRAGPTRTPRTAAQSCSEPSSWILTPAMYIPTSMSNQPATAWLSEDCGSRSLALSTSSYPWMRKRRLAIGRDRQPAGALQSGVEWPWPNRPLVSVWAAVRLAAEPPCPACLATGIRPVHGSDAICRPISSGSNGQHWNGTRSEDPNEHVHPQRGPRASEVPYIATRSWAKVPTNLERERTEIFPRPAADSRLPVATTG